MIPARVPSKRWPTWAVGAEDDDPTTAPRTPATTFHPATEARTDVGKSSLAKAPAAGAKVAAARTPNS